MSETPSPQRERSSRRRSKTADSALQKNRKSSARADLRPTTPRSPFVPPTRATSVSRHNKIYRCPPTPPPEVQYDRERSFVLDCKAVSNISNDYSTANPKLGSAIPPYIAQNDPGADEYFKFFGVKNRLQESGHWTNPESIDGRVYDRFHKCGHGFRYLSLRNVRGSGHSIDQVRGHELFLSDPKPIVNYNGLFGYRRNTPSLRNQPGIGTKRVNLVDYIPLGRFSTIGCGQSYPFHCRCRLDRPCRCHNQDKLCPCIKV